MGVRRLDWRFLLPLGAGGDPANLSLVGATDRILEVAGRVTRLAGQGEPGAARGRASEEGSSAHGSTEAFAGERPASPPTAAAAEASSPGVLAVLATGGSPTISPAALATSEVVWWEVNRLGRGGLVLPPGRLLRRLRRAGYDTTVVYWAKGGHDRCTMYLPLDEGQAIRWYFGSTLRAPAPIRWVLAAGTRLLAAIGPRALGALVPAYGVVACRGGGGPPMPTMVAAAARAGAVGQVAESAILLYGEGDWSRVVHVPFTPGAADPVAAIKHPRTSRFNQETARERATLLDLGERLGELRDAVPRPTATFEAARLRVVVEEWVGGRPMYGGRRGHSGGRAARENLGAAAEWSRRLYERTAEAPSPLAEHIPGLVEAPAAAYLERVGDTAAESALLGRFRGAAEAIALLRLPRIMEHRDFGPWNIYRTARGIVVIDWEVAERGFPLCDLLYFGMHWCWITGGATSRDDEIRGLWSLLSPVPRDDPAGAVRVEVDRYLSASGLDAALVPVLLVHMLLRQAVDVVTRREDEDGRRVTPDNRYADYVRALAARADELFQPRPVHAGRGS